ncbi:zinc-binding dehydrogenase [Actinoplanes sp. NPDC026623]|uniref:zinc-binding dehydrogenase n=1 Tax=Actinoplanes sp. NPDC026623 TaxID=3155610 RepID=UPI0033E9AD39
MAPVLLIEVEVSALSENSRGDFIRVRLSVAGMCGSDLQHFRTPGASDRATTQRLPSVEMIASDVEAGYPIHECVGRVVSPVGDRAAKELRLAVRDRVAAMPVGKRGLAAEVLLTRPEATHRVVDASLTGERATLIQPLATVRHAVSRLGEVAGARVAVIGLGPTGLLAAHLLRHRGAAQIVGIDPACRGDLPALVGVDVAASRGREAEDIIRSSPKIDACVEAVGQRAGTPADAVNLTGFVGVILALDVPVSDDYVWPFRHFFRRNLILHASVTPPRRPAMAAAEKYLTPHRILTRLITHTFDIRERGIAFVLYASESPGSGKVVLITESWNDRAVH